MELFSVQPEKSLRHSLCGTNNMKFRLKKRIVVHLIAIDEKLCKIVHKMFYLIFQKYHEDNPLILDLWLQHYHKRGQFFLFLRQVSQCVALIGLELIK